MSNPEDSGEDFPVVETQGTTETPEFVDWGSSDVQTHGQDPDSVHFKHERGN